MKLHELSIMGDDGGLHGRIDKALKNMQHHASNHKDEKIRGLCKSACERLKYHMNHPTSMFDDPHTFLRVLSHCDGEPDPIHLQSTVDTLGSYSQPDSD